MSIIFTLLDTINLVIYMNKKLGIFIIIALLLLIGIGIYFYIKNTSSNDGNANYEANKTSAENNTSNNEKTSNTEQNNSLNELNTTSTNTAPSPNTSNTVNTPKTVEEQLSAFSTKIYSNDSNRTKNMEITTTALNGTIVKNGETFSFCNTIGPSTSSKGYLEADIYDHDGNKKKGYGGGNCQVSSTLYNAVLAVSSLTVIERHPHSNHVPYVADGKDAAVASGSYDFKFRNDTGNDIKILSSVTEGLVNVTLMSLKTQ